MKNLFLLALAAAAMAACNERKASPTEPRPNYEGVRSASERSHGSLDKEAGGE